MTIAALVALLLAAMALGWLWSSKRTNQSPADAALAATDDAGAEWSAQLTLEHVGKVHDRDESSRLTIVLRNAKGSEIETPDLAFEVNGIPLDYRVRQGNYYDRHPYYQLHDPRLVVTGDTNYEISIRRNKGQALPFARLKTPAPMPPASFRVPNLHPSNQDLVVQWTGLRQSADFLIYRTVVLTDAQGNQTIEAGGPYAVDAIRHTIMADENVLREGRYVIPASYFAASDAGKVSALTIEVEAKNRGQFLHPVLRKSMVTASRKIVFHIDVIEAAGR